MEGLGPMERAEDDFEASKLKGWWFFEKRLESLEERQSQGEDICFGHIKFKMPSLWRYLTL